MTMDHIFGGNQVQGWLWALFISAIVYALFSFTRNRFLHWFNKRSPSQNTEKITVSLMMGDLVSHISRLVLLAIAVYVGSLTLVLSTSVANGLSAVMRICLFYQTGLIGQAVINLLVQYTPNKLQDSASHTIMLGFSLLGKVILWFILVLLSIENLGVNITALVASLGVGGIAVGLALQRVMGDLISSLAIILDKPFVPGDAIALDTFSGTVERIGLKTTRIRSSSGEEVIISNSDLIQSRIQNYRSMTERHIVMTFGVTYDTPASTLETIPAMVKDIVQAVPDVRFDRAHFTTLGTSSLDFEVAYSILTPDYLVFMNAQQTINLALIRQFASEKITFT